MLQKFIKKACERETHMNLEELIHKEIKRMNAQEENTAEDYKVDFPLGEYCDHTVLRAYTPQAIVKKFCDEAKEYGGASVCVNPIHVKLVSEELKGTDVKTCCVVGFPLGANTPAAKAFETKEAIENGAQEIDMVINVGALRDFDYEKVLNDIKSVVDASRGKALVKVIIETCYLTREQKIAACVLSREAGADFVKTSTGMGTGGTTVQDVRLMKMVVGDALGVKAAAGVETKEDVIAMVTAGATRVGTSRIKQIVSGDSSAFSASKENQPPKFN